MPNARAHSQLYLVLETDGHGTGLEHLEAALTVAGEAVACVLLKPRPGGSLGHGELPTAIQRLQARGLAVLVAGDAETALHLGADGVHLGVCEDEADARSRYAIARAALGSARTVGASAGLSRHLAMVLGEIGADYVAFEPDASGQSREGAAEQAQWWVPLFEVPVVVLGVESAAEADRLAAAGVEFVGVDLSDSDAEAQARHVARMAEALSVGETGR
jgi:thiamine-phosphate pyrophosphorylase